MSNDGNIFLEIIEEEEKEKDSNDEDSNDEDSNDEDLNDEDLEELNRLKEITEKLWSEEHLTHTYENIQKREKALKIYKKVAEKSEKIKAIQSNFNFSFRKTQKPVNKNSTINKTKNVRTLQRKNKTRYRGFMSF